MNLAEDWERQRAFLAVLREGSLSGAARALDLAQPTVRRRIEELEEGLSTPLFTRSPSGLVPTERALLLREHADAMALAADAFARSASTRPDELAGTVRINADEIVAIEVLPAILCSLRADHPGLVFEMSSPRRGGEALGRDADIAIRMGRPRQDALTARWAGSVSLGLYAHHDYLVAHGQPDHIDDLSDHALIGAGGDSFLRLTLEVAGVEVRRDGFAFRSESDLAQLAALRAGLGIGLCHVPLAARDRKLVRLFPDAVNIDVETWVVAHEDQRGTARIRAAFDAIVAGLADYLGRPPLQRPTPANWA